MVAGIQQSAIFDNGFGQLLDEQRYPVGARKDLVDNSFR